jgi:hypothetical protein
VYKFEILDSNNNHKIAEGYMRMIRNKNMCGVGNMVRMRKFSYHRLNFLIYQILLCYLKKSWFSSTNNNSTRNKLRWI